MCCLIEIVHLLLCVLIHSYFCFLLFCFRMIIYPFEKWENSSLLPSHLLMDFFSLFLHLQPLSNSLDSGREREREREYRINVVVVVRSKINGNFSSIFFSVFFRVSVDRLHWIHFNSFNKIEFDFIDIIIVESIKQLYDDWIKV